MDEFIGNLDTVHHIQRTILSQLTYNLWRSYNELLPDGMSGNSFNYHLNYLLKHKIVEKSNKNYTLTPLGRLVIDSMSLTEKRFKLRPTCGALLYVTHKETGKALVYKSLRQPLIGYIGLPFGKITVGQTFEEIVQRMMKRRGLSADYSYHMQKDASFNIRYFDGGELVSHRFGGLVTVLYEGDMKELATKNGESFWTDQSADLKELHALQLGDDTIIAV